MLYGGDKIYYEDTFKKWRSGTTSLTVVLQVAGSIPAIIVELFWLKIRRNLGGMVIKVTQPNSLFGRNFVINGCLTEDPLETTDRLSKAPKLARLSTINV